MAVRSRKDLYPGIIHVPGCLQLDACKFIRGRRHYHSIFAADVERKGELLQASCAAMNTKHSLSRGGTENDRRILFVEARHLHTKMRPKINLWNAGRVAGALAFAIIALATTVPNAHGQFINTVIASNLFEPDSVTVDPTGSVYVTDSSDNRIVKFAPSSGVVTPLAGGNKSTPGYVNGLGQVARFSEPLGIVYANGGLVVVDSANQLLRFVTWGGVVSTLAGVYVPNGQGGFVDGAAAGAQFSYPTGIAVDSNANLYIADSGNNAIRRLSPDGIVSTIDTDRKSVV